MDKNKDVIDIEPEVAITKVEPQSIQAVDPNAPLMVQIMQLSQQDVKPDVEYIKGLLAIKKEIDADEAKKAYAKAFSLAQADIRGVVKTRKNEHTNSMYAGLDDVILMSQNVCSANGFSIAFNEEPIETADHMRLCATVLHKGGHFEKFHYDIPIGRAGIKGTVNMTAIHAKATSVSYGKRYLLCMIWSIPTIDNDGNGGNDAPADKPEPNKAQQHFIDEVALGLTDIAAEQGRQPNTKLVQAWLFDFNQQLKKNEPYPSDEAGIAKAVKFIAAKPAALELVTRTIKE